MGTINEKNNKKSTQIHTQSNTPITIIQKGKKREKYRNNKHPRKRSQNNDI